jgi:aryl-alcohol dehydrogenase-like predicted oxidoreductase
MRAGLLTGTMTQERFDALPASDWRKHDERFAPDKLARSFELVERLQLVAARHAASLGEVAVAWTLRNFAVDGAIVGSGRHGKSTVSSAPRHSNFPTTTPQ